MGIIKHEIPILEFDTEKTAVINPTHDRPEASIEMRIRISWGVHR